MEWYTYRQKENKEEKECRTVITPLEQGRYCKYQYWVELLIAKVVQGKNI
jgi:hypothetical protein